MALPLPPGDLESTIADPAAARMAPAADAPPPPLADRYQVAERLGRGATGDVFAAQDRTFHREVAVKVMLPTSDGRRLAGFIREARVTANLAHPGIVPVYDLDFGVTGTPYFTMRRIRGTALGELLRRAATGEPPTEIATLADRVGVLRKVCDALACAHAQGVVHQDVKPDNIMVGHYGEVFLVDWGLASDSGEVAHAPRTVAGTPAYMAPEQARGEAVDTRSDVYAAGATLFHMLTGRLPLRGDAPEEFWQRKRAGALDPLSAAERSAMPRLLRMVMLKALAADPAKRYAQAGDLSADLGRWLAGLPVLAHPENLIERAARCARRRWRGLAMATTMLLVLAGAAERLHAARQQDTARWGEPLVHEDFHDATWQARWTPLVGAWSGTAGALQTEGDWANFLLLDRKLAGATAVEFTGTCLPGYPVGDLSVAWVPGARPVVDDVGTFMASPMVLAQVGAYDNCFAQVVTTLHGQGSRRDYQLALGRSYRIRVELDDGLVRLLVDGNEVARHRQAIPITGGWLLLYGYYRGKRFDDLVVHAKGLAPRLPATALGDAALRQERWDEAIAAYQDVVAADRDPDLVAQARFRMGLAQARAGRPASAAALWAGLSDGHFALPALEERCRLAWAEGEHDRALDLLVALAARDRSMAAGVWCNFIQCNGDRPLVWSPELVEGLLQVRRRCLPIDESIGSAAYDLLKGLGRYDLALSEFHESRLARGSALSALGRYSEIVADPSLPRGKWAEAAYLTASFAALAAQAPEYRVPNARALLLQGRGQEVLDDAGMPEAYRASALVDLGRGAELAQRFPRQLAARADALARSGRFGEAITGPASRGSQLAALALDDLAATRRFAAPSNPELEVRWLLGVRAFEAGDLAGAAAQCQQAEVYPDTPGFSHLLLPWLLGLAGEAGQPDAGWSALLRDDKSWRDHGRAAAIVRVIRGADPGTLDVLPAVVQRANARDVAAALRAEWQGDWPTARAAWRRLAGQQPADRWPDWDPLLVRIAAARADQLGAR